MLCAADGLRVTTVEHHLAVRVRRHRHAIRAKGRDDVRRHRRRDGADLNGCELPGCGSLEERDHHLAAGEDVAAVGVDVEIDGFRRVLDRPDDPGRRRDDALVDPALEEAVVIVGRDDGTLDFYLHFPSFSSGAETCAPLTRTSHGARRPREWNISVSTLRRSMKDSVSAPWMSTRFFSPFANIFWSAV